MKQEEYPKIFVQDPTLAAALMWMYHNFSRPDYWCSTYVFSSNMYVIIDTSVFYAFR